MMPYPQAVYWADIIRAMKLRSTIQLGAEPFTSQLYPLLSETDDHVRLKLAAQILFHETAPLVIHSPQQVSALAGQDFAPDLIKVDDTNVVRLWIECGRTTAHKLDKVTKRFRDARILMLLAEPLEAKQQSETLESEGNKRIEVWSFRMGEFGRWRKVVAEHNDIVGEATETGMNLVINGAIYVTDLERAR